MNFHCNQRYDRLYWYYRHIFLCGSMEVGVKKKKIEPVADKLNKGKNRVEDNAQNKVRF